MAFRVSKNLSEYKSSGFGSKTEHQPKRLVNKDGSVNVLKEQLDLQKDEVIDAAVMSSKALDAFYEKEIESAKEQGVLLSLHLKATMMKVSDPIMFGHCVAVFYREVFTKHAALIEELGVNVNNGLDDLYTKIQAVAFTLSSRLDGDSLSLAFPVFTSLVAPAAPGHHSGYHAGGYRCW